MMNFLLGTIAGGLVACIVTISAARHPEVQARLGLIPPAQAAVAPPANRAAAECAPMTKAAHIEARDPEADALFSRRRFWYVAPHAK